MKHIDGWWCPDILSGPGKFIRRSEVIGYALRFWHGPKRRVIQAGAHIGIWSRMLAQYFETVTCVEPAPENWECLVLNTRDTSKITRYYGMLGPCRSTGFVNIQPHGSGGHHVMTRADRPHVPVTVHTIDGWGYDDVDSIFLDIEGVELAALQGARETLQRCKPLLVCEDNGCSRKYGVETGAVGAWLAQEFGYRQVGTHGEDVIFVIPA